MSEQQQPPYYLRDRNVFSDLESQISVIPPELKPGYAQVEKTVSKAFVDQFGEFLNPKQKKYFGENQMLYTDPETASTFSQEWDEGVYNTHKKDSQLHGLYYTGYGLGSAASQSEGDPGVQPEEFPPTIQCWAGRIAVMPLAEDEVVKVDPSWLMSDDTFYALTDTMKSTTRALMSWLYSSSVGQTAVHEKVHGIQDFRLPLPIQEAAAYYYARQVFDNKKWHYSDRSNTQLFADFYASCVAELGSDVHRLIFGTIDPARREQVLENLKNKFSKEKIDELSGSLKYKPIQWAKLEVSETQEYLQERKE